ncbi:MAG: TIGR04282 family arsenosugar biosynthesis glycosyltransferase [Elusimicrobiota bacterium]
MVAADNTKCINILLKYPEPGYVKTRLGKEIGNRKASELYRNFVLDITENMKDIDAAVNIFCSPGNSREKFKSWLGGSFKYFPQEGSDLGERIKNSLVKSFKSGYKKALILGGDSPDLPAKLIKSSFKKLDSYDAVIGPADDGGYYLIAFTASGFEKEAFKGIKWGKDKVFDSTLKRLKSNYIKVLQLKKWYDIDTLDDLKKFYSRALSGGNPCSHTLEYINSLNN